MVKVIIRPLNVEFIANSVAEELVDCVKAGELEDTQAIWYLELTIHRAGVPDKEALLS